MWRTVRVRDRVRVRVSVRIGLRLTLTVNSDYTSLLISQLYCNIHMTGDKWSSMSVPLPGFSWALTPETENLPRDKGMWKVSKNLHLIAPPCELSPQKRSGMASYVLKGSHSFTCSPTRSIRNRNAFAFPALLVLIYRPGGWKAELPWVRQLTYAYGHKWWVTVPNLCSSWPSIRGYLLCFVYLVTSLYRSGPNGLWTESIWLSHTAGAGPGPPTPRINSLVISSVPAILTPGT